MHEDDQCLQHSRSFFSNTACEHFPCHEGVAAGRFNCLFCYCPLYALGEACGSWANILDPEAIVLTGTVVNAGPLWRAALEEGYASQALEPLKSTPIIPATLGGDAPLIGAAENLLDSLEA